MKRTSEYLQQRLETCKRLFFKYEGREHARIEREMRANGFPDFNRRCLYARGINDGWIERYRWDRELAWKVNSKQRIANSRSDVVSTGSGSDRGFSPSRHTQRQDAESPSQNRLRERAASSSRIDRGDLATDHTDKHGPDISGPASSASSAFKTAPQLPTDINEFHTWLKKVSPPNYDWDAKHFKYIIKKLQLFTEGKIKKLMIFMPPRHGKSELVTQKYTAWRLVKDPSLKVILASYNQHLANRFSRNIRNSVAEHFALEAPATKEHEKAQKELRDAVSTGSSSDQGSKGSPPYEGGVVPASGDGVVLSDQDSQDFFSNPFRPKIINSSAEWETGKGGGVKAVGVGGGVTGYGAGLMVIDDPIKSREQAESQTYRDKMWQWFNDDMMTRLEPDAGVILIQTRWHEDDLAGRILKQQREEGTNDWHVICLPAIAEGQTEAETQAVARVRKLQPQATKAPVKMMPARHLAFTTMPPYIPGRSYGDILQEREKAKLRNGQLKVDNGQAELLLSTVNCPPSTVPDPLGRKPGEALWPERYDLKHLERTKRRMGSYSFEALYQQKPVPTEGGLFKRAWFENNIVQTPPPNLNWKRGYDLSFAANPDCDPTATLRVAYDKDGIVYIDSCFRGRLTYPLQRKLLLHYIKHETRTEHGIELSANGHAMLQELRRMPDLRGKKFRGVKVDSSKVTRALPWIALAEEGRIRLVAGPWNKDFIAEACSFPHGKHDDQIDAVSVGIAMHGGATRNGFWKF